MPDDLRDAFREKYGIEPSEGYGTTELSPIAAVNIPASRLGGEQPWTDIDKSMVPLAELSPDRSRPYSIWKPTNAWAPIRKAC